VTKANPKTVMSPAQRVMMRDFDKSFFALMEKFWNPDNSDQYWDSLTEDAMNLLARFHTRDMTLNNMFSNMVAAFLNSREDMTI
jgi:hypothetical protein